MQTDSINENSFLNINSPFSNNIENNLINDRLSDSNNSINDFEPQILDQDKNKSSNNESSQNCNYLTNIFFDLNKREPKHENLKISSFSFSLYKNKKRGRPDPLIFSERNIVILLQILIIY